MITTKGRLRRGLLIVVGEQTGGAVGAIDVLDLDEQSFRRWLVDQMITAGVVSVSAVDASAEADAGPYRQALPVGHPRAR